MCRRSTLSGTRSVLIIIATDSSLSCLDVHQEFLQLAEVVQEPPRSADKAACTWGETERETARQREPEVK